MNRLTPNDASSPPVQSELAASENSPSSAVTSASDRGSFAKLIQNRTAVLAVLFLVTGALGIPLLWISKRFSTTERILWSLTVLLYTIVLIGATTWILWWAYQRLLGR